MSITAAMTFLNGVNMLASNSRANKAANQQAALTAAEIARNERIMELYEQGSEEMKAVMEELYGSFGTYDDVSVDNFKGMRDFFSLNRQLEDKINRGEINDEEARDLQMLFNLERDFREKANIVYNQSSNRVDDQDAIFDYNAPSTYDMAPQIDRLAQKFINARMGNAERAIDAQYSKGLANIAPGMENSTLRVQLEKNAADLRATALNDAMLEGVKDALYYTQGVQGVTAGEQTMNLAERNFGQDLLSNASDLATALVNNEINMGNYGMDVYGNYNDARTQAIDDLAGIQSLRTDAALQDWITGLNTMNAQSGIFNDYIRSQMDMAASPYKFAADGASAGSYGTALNSLNSLTSTMISNAENAASGFGTWLDRYTGWDKKDSVRDS